MLTLYHAPISTCSQKVRLCLAEKRLEFESRIIDFGNQDHLADSYLSLNPNGVVPTLVHEGTPVIDSSVICEYLDDVWPESSLTPDTALDRAEMRAWMRYAEEVPTTAIRIPSFNKLFAKVLGNMPEPAFNAMTERMPLRKAFYREMEGVQGFSEQRYSESLEKLDKTLERLDSALAHKEWVCGDRLTIADIVFVPTLVRMEDLGLQHMWSNRLQVARWFAAIQKRESFARAYFEGSRVNADAFNLQINLD